MGSSPSNNMAKTISDPGPQSISHENENKLLKDELERMQLQIKTMKDMTNRTEDELKRLQDENQTLKNELNTIKSGNSNSQPLINGTPESSTTSTKLCRLSYDTGLSSQSDIDAYGKGIAPSGNLTNVNRSNRRRRTNVKTRHKVETSEETSATTLTTSESSTFESAH